MAKRKTEEENSQLKQLEGLHGQQQQQGGRGGSSSGRDHAATTAISVQSLLQVPVVGAEANLMTK
jgi:hypothetical protein